MRSYWQLSMVFLFGFMFNTACNSSTDEKPVEAIKKDSTVVPVIPPAALKPTLRETILNEKTFITEKKLHNSTKIDPAAFRSLSVRAIDSTGGDENGFRYHIVDTLFLGQNVKVLLIGREYESENYAWIAVYDGNDKLLDHKTVYYDNAEGFMSVETTIKNNLISITTFNEYAEKDKEKKITETFLINENNKIVKAL